MNNSMSTQRQLHQVTTEWNPVTTRSPPPQLGTRFKAKLGNSKQNHNEKKYALQKLTKNCSHTSMLSLMSFTPSTIVASLVRITGACSFFGLSVVDEFLDATSTPKSDYFWKSMTFRRWINTWLTQRWCKNGHLWLAHLNIYKSMFYISFSS